MISVPLNLLTVDDGGFKKILFKFGCHWWWQRRKDGATKLLAVKQQAVEGLEIIIAPRHFPHRFFALWIVYFGDSKSQY